MPWLLGLVVLIAAMLAVYRYWYLPLCLRVGRVMTIAAVLAVWVLVWVPAVPAAVSGALCL